jgi:ribosomal subunit interface protein
MQVTITGRHLDLFKGFKDKVNEKIPKLEKYDVDIRYVDVVLDKQGSLINLELKIGLDHHDPLILSSSEDPVWNALDSVIAKAERQLRRTRKKDLEGRCR